ncbi:MAG: hypothetical protein K0S44_1529 [Bacteroidetes bacterium]|jgi:hypothetical protein|nr:hypothetical protein [Bacteroidota bacterium]
MGMDINIYTKGLSPDLIPKIRKRFTDFSMDIEFHPEFKFDEKTDTGFLPIKLHVQKGHSKAYDDFGEDVMTGFELFFNNFDYETELKEIQSQNTNVESKSFISKLLGRNKQATQTESFIVDREVDKKLKTCDQYLMLNFKSWNKSELRISLYFAAILADLTNGIVVDPQEGRYLSGQDALKTFPLEVDKYEQSISADEFKLDRFEGWI